MNILLDGEETERLVFRKIVTTDFDSWLPFHKDKKTSEFWNGLPQNPETACNQDLQRTFYRYKNNLGGKNALLLKKTGILIGQCGLLVHEIAGVTELEIGYDILPKYWKQGYATEAAIKCKTYVVQKELSTTLISIIHINNIPSQKVAITNGMFLDKSLDYHGNPVHIYRIKL